MAEGDEELVLDALDMLLASAYALKTVFKAGQQQQSTATAASASFDWKQLDAIVSELSKQSTNIALMFDGNAKPKGKDGVAMCEKLQAPVVALASFLHHSLPTVAQSIGKAGAEQVRDFASRLAESLVKFIVSVKSPDNHGRLRQTGVVWEHCDVVVHLPRDPSSAAVVVIDRQVAMVRDAVDELQTTAQSIVDDDKQLAIVNSVLGMVKCVLAVLSKLKSALEERGANHSGSDAVQAVDELTAQLEELSSTVDDVVGELYSVQEQLVAPVESLDADSLNSAADLLRSRLSQLLTTFASCVFYIQTEDGQRAEFLTKAIEHNRSKLHLSIVAIST